ncbi:MAG: hypothetical protein MUC36_23205 [Planctomycetes bacterium]|jgi:hypothetical protein|nr:hypothetical protein [Planctomycetota bacterium]
MSQRALWGLGALLAAWSLLLAYRSPVPSEDGVSYLWIAERFAAGDFAAALSTVFPPGYPLLLAPFVALGLDVERAAQGFGALTLAATLWPLSRLATIGGAVTACPAVLLFVASPLPSRLVAEVYSEPPYLLLMAWGAWFGCRGRMVAMGSCAALAFWIRPEGSLLAASFVLVMPRRAWPSLLPVALGVLVLAAWRQAVGHGFDPLPIHAFHEGRDDLPERGLVLHNLVALPGPWFEGLAVAGLLVLPTLRPSIAPVLRPFVWQVLLQVAVICTFVVRRRFFVSCAVAVHVLAGTVLARWPRRVQYVVLAVALAIGLVSGWNGGIDRDRAVERDLGAWLRPQLRAGERLVSDLPRVAYFAAQRPLPPRHFTAAQLLALVAAPEVAVVVLRDRSERVPFAELEPQLAPRFDRVALPAGLAEAAAVRGVAVFRRR